MISAFHSQAGQDRFVYALAEHLESGSFLDVGCSDPVSLSNTYALEQVGWRGVLIDHAPHLAELIAEKRASPFVCGDAATVDWDHVLSLLPAVVDYLSFDVDEAGLHVLRTLPWSRVRFRVLTVEHDAYRFGDGPRTHMRALLLAQGYELLCPNVMNGGAEFEDWWIDPKTVDSLLAERFRTSAATAWTDIVSR